MAIAADWTGAGVGAVGEKAAAGGTANGGGGGGKVIELPVSQVCPVSSSPVSSSPVSSSPVSPTGRVGMISSRLLDAETPIHAMAQSFQRYLYLPDPQVLYAVMGAMAGNCLTGNPVWMMLVGSSGGGKTAILKSLLGLGTRVRPVSSIKGEAAFLSGTDRKKMAKDATGGVLKELGENGCLLFLDLTTLMSKPKEEVTLMLGALREMFSRDYVRDIGGEGGRPLRHTGRVSVMAGVTAVIDHKDEVSREMGSRCIYYRLPESTGYQESRSAVEQDRPEEMETDLQNMVNCMYYSAGLRMEELAERPELGQTTADRIVNLAQFGARARSHVPRDQYSREKPVVDEPMWEMPTRMAQELTQLYLGMQAIGVDEEDRWRVVEKCAVDSMPRIRAAVSNRVAGEGLLATGARHQVKEEAMEPVRMSVMPWSARTSLS